MVRLFGLSGEALGGGGVNYQIIDNFNSYYLDLTLITFFNYINLFTDACPEIMYSNGRMFSV